MPDPTGLVAWEAMRVGETYWGCVDIASLPLLLSLWDTDLGNAELCETDGTTWVEHELLVSPEGNPMIYATCADACRAMIQRLKDFMAEQGEGNA